MNNTYNTLILNNINNKNTRARIIGIIGIIVEWDDSDDWAEQKRQQERFLECEAELEIECREEDAEDEDNEDEAEWAKEENEDEAEWVDDDEAYEDNNYCSNNTHEPHRGHGMHDVCISCNCKLVRDITNQWIAVGIG